ncbi:hypothetical protein KDN32_17365 [Nocardioides sp. J2M5]|uniref:hypothetical protein n=1 Tax=Nocardioides palaemonis TaxID=2829810 RepID=UPI001BAA5748|nr:hypothetical protein [Nocardioides palaemonis]MBS2939514.1 hypothetical protein [Nocardioides palaemonis]
MSTLAGHANSSLSRLSRAVARHVALVRRLVFDALTPAQARALGEACRLVTARIDEDRAWRPGGPASAG